MVRHKTRYIPPTKTVLETPDDRIAFNILLSRHLGKMAVQVNEDGATYRIASISGKGAAIVGDRLGNRWELDDQPTSKEEKTILEFGPEFEECEFYAVLFSLPYTRMFKDVSQTATKRLTKADR